MESQEMLDGLLPIDGYDELLGFLEGPRWQQAYLQKKLTERFHFLDRFHGKPHFVALLVSTRTKMFSQRQVRHPDIGIPREYLPQQLRAGSA
jgi:hypothetical protein